MILRKWSIPQEVKERIKRIVSKFDNVQDIVDRNNGHDIVDSSSRQVQC